MQGQEQKRKLLFRHREKENVKKLPALILHGLGNTMKVQQVAKSSSQHDIGFLVYSNSYNECLTKRQNDSGKSWANLSSEENECLDPFNHFFSISDIG